MENTDQIANIRITANVDIYGFDANDVPDYETYIKLKESGELEKHIKYHDSGKNLVVNAGLNQVIALIIASSTTAWNFCGVGSGTALPTATDIDLTTPIGRIAVTQAYQVSNVGHFDTFFSSTQQNGTWNESGIFTAVSAGIMLCHKILAATFTKSTSNTATVAWAITLTAV